MYIADKGTLKKISGEDGSGAGGDQHCRAGVIQYIFTMETRS